MASSSAAKFTSIRVRNVSPAGQETGNFFNEILNFLGSLPTPLDRSGVNRVYRMQE